MRMIKKLLIVAMLVSIMMPGNLIYGQSYPSSPATMIVAWAPGGVADTVARALAESTRSHFGQPIVVQDIPGAGGAQGAYQLIASKPDGYTMIFTTASLVTQPHFENVPYKALEDFIPVLQVSAYPVLMVVRADSPFNTYKELVDYAKKNPRVLNYSTAGFGSINHLIVEELSMLGGFKMTHVPFKALAEGVTALLGGHIKVAIASPVDIMSHLPEGRVKALGIAMRERYKEMPNIPTFKEMGFDAKGQGWYGIAVPKGTPDVIVKKLHDSFKKGIADPPFTTVMNKSKTPIEYLNGQDTMKRWREEYKIYSEIAKTLKQ